MPADIDAVVVRALAPDAAARFPEAGRFADALDRCLTTPAPVDSMSTTTRYSAQPDPASEPAGRRLAAPLLGLVAALVLVLGTAIAAQSLASVRLPRAVMANGQALAAGTYAVRLSSEAVTPVVGQSAEGTRWVEFVQGNQVRGKELATVLSGDEVGAVVEGTRPASGTAKVELLKGEEYLRVWINGRGTHYLIHLAVAPGR